MSGREPMDEQLRRYNEPGETPREEMWQAIVGRIAAHAGGPTAPAVEELDEAPSAYTADRDPVVLSLRRRQSTPWLRWAAAASVVLLVGIALGRSTAPGGPGAADTGVPTLSPPLAGAVEPRGGLDVVVRGHLGRTESLLAAVRSDGRQGRLDPTAAGWARGLLAQTRLLLDASADADPTLVALLEELELVLAGVVVVAETGSTDEPRGREELDLVLQALDVGPLLPRLQAACSGGCAAPQV